MLSKQENIDVVSDLEELNQLFDKYTFIEETARSCEFFQEFTVLVKGQARHASVVRMDIKDLSEERLQKLKQEVLLASNLTHPNLIKTQHYWIHEDKLFVQTSEISGTRLDAFVGEGRLSLKRCLEIAIQIAALLEYLHNEKIYHTGVWPRSVYVDKDYFVHVDPAFMMGLIRDQSMSELRKTDASSYVNLDIQGNGEELKSDIRSVAALACYLSTGYAPDMIPAERWDEYGLDTKLTTFVGKGVGEDDYSLFTMMSEVVEALETIQKSKFSGSGMNSGDMKTKMHRLKATADWGAETAALKTSLVEANFHYDSGAEANLLNERYEIGKCLESNLINKIFEAYDRMSNNQKVWVHILDYDGKPQWSYSFREISQRLFSVRHPHICQVFDYALLDEVGYISSQKEDGDRLLHFSRRHKFDETEIKQFITQVSGALSSAHKAGFYTYFLSPETISVYGHPEGGYFYRILCVGYDQLIRLERSETARMSLLRRPEYYAPEIHNGELLGYRTTQFILGNLILKLMLGFHPCENMTLDEAFVLHSSDKGIELPDDIGYENEKFRKWLNRILAPDPEKRFGTPEMMINAFMATEF